MKLKLKDQNGFKVLAILEDVDATHVPILKAGINKLFLSGAGALILDLSGIKKIAPETLQAIAGLKAEAQKIQAHLIVCGPQDGVVDHPDVEAGIQAASSSLAVLMATEAKLQAYIKELQTKKAAIENQIKATGATVDPKDLARECSDLKRTITSLERETTELLKARGATPPTPVPPLPPALQQSLHAVLEQEEILAEKKK